MFETTYRVNLLMLTMCSAMSLYTAMHVNHDTEMQAIFILIALAFLVFPLAGFWKWLQPRNYLNVRKAK